MEDADEKMAAAEALIRLSHSSPYWPPAKTYDLWPVNRPQTATILRAIPSPRLPRWGRRSRRSRCSCIPEKANMEEESSGPASKIRRSPATPLDFGSALAPSTSGSDEAPSTSAIPENKCRRGRGGDPSSPFGDVYRKVGTAELSPVVGVAISSSKPVRRREKKKTVTELQAQVRSLAEEREMLRQCVERKRKEMEDLIAENHRLRGEEGSRWLSKAVKARFIFPDLNEAATET
ncbi:hypothetical protein KSP39_PZI023030 [Platanthera zijinensis]|uniref:Uncharacterized protein n=1 Tax=Platanthera zijinensis TaxID=2320716 RepID=A0AAP0AUI0_9ASPA